MDAGFRAKRPNPRQDAGLLSTLFFWWTFGLFREGYTKDLEMQDLFVTLKKDQSSFVGDLLERSWKKEVQKEKPKFWRAVMRAFWWPLARQGLMLFVMDVVIRLSQPLLLRTILQHFQPNTSVTLQQALLSAGLLTMSLTLIAFIANHQLLDCAYTGMRVRAACCSLIYRKSLRLSRTALGEASPGHVVNLLSNDVSRFDIVTIFIHYMWTSPLAAFIISYLLWNEMGYAAFVGIAVVLFVLPLLSFTGRLNAVFRRRTALKSDERIRLMDEIISSMQVIKMYAWEKPFAALVSLARKLELDMVSKNIYLRGLYMTFTMSTTRIALCGSLITLALSGNPIHPDTVFVALAYFNTLSFTLSMMFVRGVAELSECFVSIERIQNFLLFPEHDLKEPVPKIMTNGATDKEKKGSSEGRPAVNMVETTAQWNPGNSDPTLTNIDLTIAPGKLVIVIGQVGAGKSSLLQTLLNELAVTGGTCEVSGSISYASQEPWVFTSTIRQNILFGQPFDRQRYNKVIQVCALQRDLAQFPQGDLTVVGERGASLSGGQKARVNLARAVYRDADVYLLDDPLSAVDTHVAKHLFDECINGYLAAKTRILVTHQLQFVYQANYLVVLNNGEIQAQGPPLQLGRQLSGVENVEGEEPGVQGLLRQISKLSTASKTSDKTSYTAEEKEEETQIPAEMQEKSSKGRATSSIYFGYAFAGNNYLSVFLIFVIFLATQAAASGADYFMSYWTNLEDLQSHSNIPVSLDRNMCMYIYSGVVASMFILALTRSMAFSKMCIKSSQRLHDFMFHSVSRTGMRFFHINPTGRILNRFSKDMGSIDELLPKAILDAAQVILQIAGSLLISITASYYYAIPIAILSVIFWIMRKVYLKTALNLKRLESITKSPVFTHLHATLQGLTTVRAFQAQDVLRNEFDRQQDLHTSAWSMFIAAGFAFGFSLDILCVAFIALVSFTVLFLSNVMGGSAGLAISQAMSITGMIQWGMRQSAEVTNQMMAVERVLEYKDLDHEPNLDPTSENKPPTDWPSKGQIEFQDVSLRYSPKSDPAVVGLSVVIKPMEKVGIVGRTGAGKSSIIQALFRLAWVEGSVKIDGIDTKDINLHDLRTRISIIPQDPVLFSGTMRRNLDPFSEFPDHVLWNVLEEVELRDCVPETLGLDTKVQKQGDNFSVGQRQLICLARAILRRNKILMLDEATANIDQHTDKLIQKTLRQKFHDCTVLTIAHRLNTIMDSDKVLVMDYGRMVEFGHPHVLLKDQSGVFYGMVQETGPAMATSLTEIAQKAYEACLDR